MNSKQRRQKRKILMAAVKEHLNELGKDINLTEEFTKLMKEHYKLQEELQVANTQIFELEYQIYELKEELKKKELKTVTLEFMKEYYGEHPLPTNES